MSNDSYKFLFKLIGVILTASGVLGLAAFGIYYGSERYSKLTAYKKECAESGGTVFHEDRDQVRLYLCANGDKIVSRFYYN